MIIAVDYDGTLESGGRMNLRLINRLRQEQRHGHTVILWTCREGEALRDALRSLAMCRFAPNLVNANAPERIAQYGGDSRKIYADVYIDDKAIKP